MNRRFFGINLLIALFIIGIQISNAQYENDFLMQPDQKFQVERRMSRTAKFRGEPIRFGKRAYREPIRFGKRSSPQQDTWTDSNKAY